MAGCILSFLKINILAVSNNFSCCGRRVDTNAAGSTAYHRVEPVTETGNGRLLCMFALDVSYE